MRILAHTSPLMLSVRSPMEQMPTQNLTRFEKFEKFCFKTYFFQREFVDYDALVMNGSIHAYFEYKRLFIEAEVKLDFADIEDLSRSATDIKVLIC